MGGWGVTAFLPDRFWREEQSDYPSPAKLAVAAVRKPKNAKRGPIPHSDPTLAAVVVTHERLGRLKETLACLSQSRCSI